MKRISIIAIWAILALAPTLWAQQVAVQEYVLQNGLRLLMIPKKGDPNVAAGWIARVGSVNERPGITGLSHLFEHMMFKGTHAIGTTDIQKDLELMARMDDVKAEIRKEEQAQIRRLRLGQIANLQDPKNRTARHNELLQELAAIEKESKALIVQNEFDKIYTNAGASGLNAGTSEDYTVYFINVPANKLELWFWMESDRLMNPVFREFYSERDVVHEERRMTNGQHAHGKVRRGVQRDVLDRVALRLARSRLAQRSGRPHAPGSAGLFCAELRSQQPHRLSRRRLRSGAGQSTWPIATSAG